MEQSMNETEHEHQGHQSTEQSDSQGAEPVYYMDPTNVCLTDRKHPMTTKPYDRMINGDIIDNMVSGVSCMVLANDLIRFVRFLRSVQRESVKVSLDATGLKLVSDTELGTFSARFPGIGGREFSDAQLDQVKSGSSVGVEFLYDYFKPFKVKDFRNAHIRFTVGHDRPVKIEWTHGMLLVAPRVVMG